MDDSPILTHPVDDTNRKTANVNTDDVHFSTSNAFGNNPTAENQQNNDKVNFYFIRKILSCIFLGSNW